MSQIVGLVLAVLLASVLLGANARQSWNGRTATLNGRTGKVVSFFPYDLRVTLNVEATEEEIAAMPEWRRYFATGRTWVTGWRWQVQLEEPQ